MASGKRCSLDAAASYRGAFGFGELIYIPAAGTKMILDTGSGPRDRRPWIDIWTPDYWEALRKGAYWRTVYQFMPCELAMLGEVRSE